MKVPRVYCDEHGKNCYDKRGAETARNKRWKEDHVRLRMYNCPDCGEWHLSEDTDEPPRKKKRKML